MEKISLYNLLTILLPGALLTLVLELMGKDVGIEIDSIEINSYFKLTLFLSSSIFIGSIINIVTIKMLKTYRKIGLYKPISEIYNSSKELELIKPFLENEMKALGFKRSKNKSIEQLWTIIYYDLEANEKISSAKAFQSFYFFFRNFFTLGIVLFIPLLFLVIYQWLSPKYIFLFSINLVGILLSITTAKWNRIKMVERMFWTYYSLNKNK